jgi:hypothetical protein
MKFIEKYVNIYNKRRDPMHRCSHTRWGLGREIIETYSYGCKVERHSNPGPLGTCEDDFICTRPAFT